MSLKGYTDKPPSFVLPWKKDIEGVMVSTACARCSDDLRNRAVVHAKKIPTEEWEVVETYCTVCAPGVEIGGGIEWEIMAEVGIEDGEIDTSDAYLLEYYTSIFSA